MELRDIKTIDQLCGWAAANHVSSPMPHDWLPLLRQAFVIGQVEAFDAAIEVVKGS